MQGVLLKVTDDSQTIVAYDYVYAAADVKFTETNICMGGSRISLAIYDIDNEAIRESFDRVIDAFNMTGARKLDMLYELSYTE